MTHPLAEKLGLDLDRLTAFAQEFDITALTLRWKPDTGELFDIGLNVRLPDLPPAAKPSPLHLEK